MENSFKKLIDKTFWKFMLVGIANTLFGTAVMLICYNFLQMGYWASSAMNYILGSILSYFLNKNFTFRSKDNSLGSVLRFAANIILCYAIAYSAAKPLVALIFVSLGSTWQGNLSLLAGSGVFIILNYLGQRFFVFKKQ